MGDPQDLSALEMDRRIQAAKTIELVNALTDACAMEEVLGEELQHIRESTKTQATKVMLRWQRRSFGATTASILRNWRSNQASGDNSSAEVAGQVAYISCRSGQIARLIWSNSRQVAHLIWSNSR